MLNAILELVASDPICLLHRKDKFAEALEAEYLVQELVETYSRALPQVSLSFLCTDRYFHVTSQRFASSMYEEKQGLGTLIPRHLQALFLSPGPRLFCVSILYEHTFSIKCWI